ncbi:MAG: toprim domain-containing protein, partial [Clostridia bacterium]
LLNKKKVRDRLYLLLNDAAAYYQKNLLLPTSKIAQDYIKKRNLTNVELQNFQIGYSKDWTDVISFLKSKNYSLEEMKEAGIIEFKNERPYDVFGGRLMFPIVNTYGDCVGFSARQLEKSDFAKYKNSSQTLVFDKSKIVYGINLIKKLKLEKHLDYIVIVEGQMDVIAMHKAGFVNAVACMGTALTQFHAKEIKRFC